ncbi:mitochondrial division protein 1-like [Teratosphaeria destructans]|uniref:Mitochondrial division protein 1 n=1 Tax=Teratosphaeria destructans TaxID=418781 RepID=A0A9W7SIE9_9PEZI|nr:mitochondrial division protein 1-like [Teratosphaeria destructans]
MENRGRSPRRSTPAQYPDDWSNNNHNGDDANFVNTRQIEQFGRTVTATASQLISANFPSSNNGGESTSQDSYRSALSALHRQARRPMIQRSVFSFAKANPRELIRSVNTSEIEFRALTYLPDDMIRNAPASQSPFSLFDGFKASLPDDEFDRARRRKRHSRHGSKGQKLLEGPEEDLKGPPQLVRLKKDKGRLDHRLEMMGIRKTMCASEIKEIDSKIANLNTMRRVVLDRLAGLEQEEHDLELEIGDVAEKLEVLQEELEDEAALAKDSPSFAAQKDAKAEDVPKDEEGEGEGFMSESIYGKLPKQRESPRSKRKANRMPKRTISMPVLHEHMEPGSRIREITAHNDTVTAVDFDAPFGTMVTAALDDTVRVWDLNAGRCMGLLEGHLSSVRCLQVEENIVATGSMDASIRLWDLSQADYDPHQPVEDSITSEASKTDEDADSTGEGLFTPTTSSEPDQSTEATAAQAPPEPVANSMADCHLTTLDSHVAEVTALHFQGKTLVSGSADKTLRQWDLETGRCVQTLDVLWAAAQAATINPSFNTGVSGASSAADSTGGGWWRPTQGRVSNSAEADFVGALQVFDAALACGTADGMVRLWDLRSGMVHRSLVGHTGPVTALQFDDVYLVTGSRDRSVRVWDLRMGGIHDAYAYDGAITSMMFDSRRIVCAVEGEIVVKVYDKVEGRHWDCGDEKAASVVEGVRIRDGYLVEGRRDGRVGVWSC